MSTYNRSIRKLVVGFGNLFNAITLVRYNTDQTEQERMIVPIAYASKEDYVMRLQSDPDLDKKVQLTLPRLSFQLTGLAYDITRKQNTNIKNYAVIGNNTVSQYNPVPYNFDFSLYLYIRNIEDGTQIIEHILSYFTPDYTIKINMIPEMGTVKEIPIILVSTDMPVDFEGGARDRETRVLIWTINFTVKGYIFGNITDSSSGIIKTSITNILNDISYSSAISFNMGTPGIGNYQLGEMVYQGYSIGTATATGKVVGWADNSLTLTNISGNFVSSQSIIGGVTNASYNFVSYQITPQNLARIVVTPNPTNANANSIYTYTTQITENRGV